MSKKTQLFLLLQFTVRLLFGQVGPTPANFDYAEPKDFEIGGVKVSGTTNSDERAILKIAGFTVGDRIRVPGPAITTAQQNLMRQGLFTDVKIIRERMLGDVIFLEIVVQEQARLSGHAFRGVKKSRHEDLNEVVNRFLRKGTIVTPAAKTNCRTAIQQYFLEKGFADAKVMVHEEPGWQMENSTRLVFEISEGEKVKVQDIHFHGNTKLSSRKLQKLLPTKPRRRLLSGSKFLPEEWDFGKKSILQRYQSMGYLDARFVTDSIWRNAETRWEMLLEIKEGQRYYFGDITWEGNSKHPTEKLNDLLGIEPGQVYDPMLLDRRLRFSERGNDISSLYLDDGHLFFDIREEPIALRGDTIDLRIRIFEGQQATVDKVVIRGNTRTNEHVIRRELYTEPGKKFSRADIIRSQRTLATIGFFDPENIEINTPVNPERGTVDIEYTVVEKENSQVELSGTWGGKDVGIAGTVGLTLNNFSVKNMLAGNWNPFPSGDGQTVSFRVQSNGKQYQSYNFSFTEPWLGGKKPNALSFGGFYTRYTNGASANTESFESFGTLGASVSLGTRLSWPDDSWVSSTALNFRQYRLQNWSDGLFRTDEGELVSQGQFNDLSIQQTFSRSTVNHPFFPTSGCRVSLSMTFTPPWSLLGADAGGDPTLSQRFKMLEYHKWRVNAEWYTQLTNKLVLRTSAKFGFLGAYDSGIGTSPFERFQLGGDALTNGGNTFTGTDVITLRGYEVSDLENNFINGQATATPIFNKFTVELRYPLMQGNGMNVYGLAFAEAGNSYRNFKSYNPFDLKRSAGIGLRAQVPMIGTIGFDYGIGFDKSGANSLKGMGNFSVIIGFEPD